MKHNIISNKFFFTTLLLLTAITFSSCETKATEFKMHKGINVSTWLSHTDALSGKEVEGYFTRKHLDQLAEMGFDHVRLPIAEDLLYTSELSRDETTFRLLHDMISWCKDANMTIALNLHLPRAGKKVIGMEESQEERDKIVAIWDDLSSEFGKYPNELVAYEIYNEPNFKSDSLWNAFAADMINCIRKKEPERIIILAPNADNSIAKLPVLQLPEDRKNIIVSVHYYQPAILTHYGVGKLKDIRVKLQYPGNIFPEGALDDKTEEETDVLKLFAGTFNLENHIERLTPVVEYAKNNGVRIRCGEYGSNNRYEEYDKENGQAMKVRYFQDVVKAFDQLGIPHCLWGYKATFGIFNKESELNNPDVVTAITGWKETQIK